jgi:hypothetical protein
MAESYFVASPGVLGIRTNAPRLKWSFGIATPPSDEDAYARCAARICVRVERRLAIDKNRLSGKYHYFGGREGLDELYYDRSFLFGSRLQLSVEGILGDEPKVAANRAYYRFVSHRFMNLHSLGYILTDLAGTLLLRKGYAPIHCSAFRFGDATVVVAAPPNTGKTLTTMMACLEHGAQFLAEDLAITDGFMVHSVPWTSTFRYYRRVDRSVLSSLRARLTRWMPLVELLSFGNPQPITKYVAEDRMLPRSRITHVVILERGEAGIRAVDSEEALRKVANLNRYEFNYHKAPLVVAHEFFNEGACLRRCCEAEQDILRKMVTGASRRWIVRATDPTTYAASIVEALERGRESRAA